jgi:hypothetical protein
MGRRVYKNLMGEITTRFYVYNEAGEERIAGWMA